MDNKIEEDVEIEEDDKIEDDDEIEEDEEKEEDDELEGENKEEEIEEEKEEEDEIEDEEDERREDNGIFRRKEGHLTAKDGEIKDICKDEDSENYLKQNIKMKLEEGNNFISINKLQAKLFRQNKYNIIIFLL